MLTARILSDNGRDNIDCYAAGVNGNLPVGTLACANEGGRVLGLEWATPCSLNGVTVTRFDYQMANAGSVTKPRADSVKVIVIEDTRDSGRYKKALVPDAYEIATFIAACCAGCAPIADVTVPPPFIFNGACVLAAPAASACSNQGSVYVDALTGANTTYTATPLGFTAAGVPIVFAPATSTGTTVALLAASMQTNWAAELGSGTFTATGNVIYWTSVNGAKLALSIVQS